MESILRFGHLRVLHDADRTPVPAPGWFDPDWWRARKLARAELGGRGEALAVDGPAGPAVLRGYRRGGLVQHVVKADYLYLGLDATRAFREWRLTDALARRGLPVPVPLAAAVWTFGLRYRAALLTRRLDGQPLSAVAADLDSEAWHRLGRTLRRFARAGVVHPDLNAGNVLIDPSERFHLLDFDRARTINGNSDAVAMVDRLERSLLKLRLAHDRDALLEGTREAAG
ncbi:MAG: 3-deoxy-D-manno-octulosonic acid kinase [Wenzhouxiangellaceae bacterium]|nr:3-deoxy-D-manno-octulosonic acid kinase [Wenzhouxiangellaceae bacterium]